MTTDRDKPELKLGAHVLIQLGSELVTDVEQAILECVKNAYDADSPGCLVDIRTTERGVRTETGPAADLAGFVAPAENVEVTIEDLVDPAEGQGPYSHAGSGDGEAEENGGKVPLVRRSLHYVGRITIEDKGEGLTAEQLKTSWLVISRSRKRGKAGEPKRKTTKGRTPLGDKGLGRLGTMKLGDILSVESATDQDGELSTAQFRWADCETAETLDLIPVTLGSSPNPERFKGTRVSVYGLRDIKDWGRRRKVDELTASLASLISPFEGTSSFPVRLRLDGNERSLAAATNEVLKRAVAEFEFRWGDTGSGRRELRTFARLRKDLLAPKRGKEDRTAAVFGADGGAAFEAFLQGQPRRKAWDRIRFDRGGLWYVEAEATYTWSDILSVDGPEIADPGQFEGRLYFFHLDAFEVAARRDREPELDLDAAMSTADSAVAGMAITRDFVKSMTGVSILRDGFRVRSPGDWLDLSAEMTSGSTYGLRAENTIGYFALTGEHNYGLIEKSDREGFVEDATYRGFLELARRCRGFSTNAMVQVRRGLDDFYRTIQAPPGKAPRTAKDAIGTIEQTMRTAREAQSVAEDAVTNLQAEMDAVTRDAAKAGPAAARAMQLANTAMKAIETVRGKLGPDIGSDMTVARLRHEFEDRQEQAIALFESAAVGLSARGLAHELRTHLTEIRSRATALHAAAGSGASEAALMPHLRAIRGACSASQNAAALIDPMLPRSRATRETFSVASFAEEYVANRSLSFEQAGIAVEVVDGSEGAQVRMNRARLLQVFDNLVRNSVYWVRRGVALDDSVGAPAIHIGIEPGGFTVSDTGPGVDPRVEDSLFELFVSGKPDRDGGQGIGLFIIGQLLGLDGCMVGLLPDRNANGRRHVFTVDLSAVTV